MIVLGVENVVAKPWLCQRWKESQSPMCSTVPQTRLLSLMTLQTSRSRSQVLNLLRPLHGAGLKPLVVGLLTTPSLWRRYRVERQQLTACSTSPLLVVKAHSRRWLQPRRRTLFLGRTWSQLRLTTPTILADLVHKIWEWKLPHV